MKMETQKSKIDNICVELSKKVIKMDTEKKQ